ncbi:MAG: methyltransferase domain-containing protein [Chloroflexi bacterium]|nr:methyltransferase domain-containing protein [Chloroflexota bacterium]
MNSKSSFLSVEDWDRQLCRQAEWLRPHRFLQYRHAGLVHAKSVLDLGCGTGRITVECSEKTSAQVTGLDFDPRKLEFARSLPGRIKWVEGSAFDLPFPDESFDIVLCHYVLLWLEDRERALSEVRRVLAPGGCFLILCEPDYNAAIEEPDLGIVDLYRKSLLREGADLSCGRKLPGMLSGAGMKGRVGVVNFSWEPDFWHRELKAEQDLRRKTWKDLVSPQKMEELFKKEEDSLDKGERFFWLPMFYALAKKKQ